MTTATCTADRDPVLTPAVWPFYLNAAIDAVLGLDLLLFAGWIAGLILPGDADIAGIAAPALLRGIGVVLLIAGVETAVMARSPARWRRGLWAIAGLNAAAAALLAADLLFAAGMLSAIGILLMIALAAGSLALAVLQIRALRAVA